MRAFDQYVAAAGGSVHVTAASFPVARLFELAGLQEDAAQVPAPPEPGPLPPLTAHERGLEAWAIAGT